MPGPSGSQPAELVLHPFALFGPALTPVQLQSFLPRFARFAGPAEGGV